MNDFNIISREICGVCGEFSEFFLKEKYILYREATCKFCGAALRNSDMGHSIVKILLNKTGSLRENYKELQKFKILEASSLGPINDSLKESFNYFSFEYCEDVKPGILEDGIWNDNLENLSFEDKKFDLVITQDVLEHVKNPEKAFFEINRVLKPNGHHIFTIPYHENEVTIDRRDLMKVYHGDQLRENGSIVYTDWGHDITKILEQFGFSTDKYCLHKWFEKREISNVDLEYIDYIKFNPLEYFRYNSWVFISKKACREV